MHLVAHKRKPLFSLIGVICASFGLSLAAASPRRPKGEKLEAHNKVVESNPEQIAVAGLGSLLPTPPGQGGLCRRA